MNQKQFTKMIQLRHTLPGIGRVRLMVGVKKQDGTKVQYCITSIEAMLEAKSKAASLETACKFAHVSGITLKVRAGHAGLRAFTIPIRIHDLLQR